MPKIAVNKIHEVPLKRGDAGVSQTISLMKHYINKYKNHTDIQRLASRLKGATEFKTAVKCFDFVHKKIKYQKDPANAELVISPLHTVLGDYNEGDCDDMVVALATLLRANNLKVAIKTIAWRPGNKNFTHVYLMTRIPQLKGWIPCDVTIGKIGIEIEYHRHRIWHAQ